MARLMVKGAVAFALIAAALQYFGITPPIPGLQMLLPRLGGATPRTINAPKLLADLNSDISDAPGAPTFGSGDSGRAEDVDYLLMSRAASAAVSVMYLASIPGLREQVKQTPGIMESLVRRMMTIDLEKADRVLLRQRHQRHQQHQQQQQGRYQGDATSDVVSSVVLALAKMAAGDRPLQDRLLGAGRGKSDGGRGAKAQIHRDVLLARLEQLLHSGVPAWQVAASYLLYALSDQGGDRGQARTQLDNHHDHVQTKHHPLVLSWVSERAEALVQVGRSLMEAGAHFHSSDALLGGSLLLQLVAVQPGGRRMILEKEVVSLLVQVVVSYAGGNSSSPMVAGAAQLLQRLTAATAAEYNVASPEGGKDAATTQLVQNLTAAGLVAPLVREVRLGQSASLGPSLELLTELMRGDRSEGQDVAREAVGAGVLSLCTQLLFKASPDTLQAHSACCGLMAQLKHRRGPRESSGAITGDLEGLEAGGGNGVGAEEEGIADRADGSGGAAASAVCDRSEGGRVALATELMHIMRETKFADLHNAVLDACRDVAPSRAAALALAEAGIVRHLTVLLYHNTTTAAESAGRDDANVEASAAWILHSQRSAAALVALLALQADLRVRLVAEGALGALVSALRVYSGRSGLMAQVRITAAAALVPLLGEDSRFLKLAAATGALDPLLGMLASGQSQEVTVAARVMRLLAREEAVAELLRNLDIKV